MKYSKILGTGSYLPEKILTNAQLEKMVDTTDEWIVSRSGIKERRIIAENQNTNDLCYYAAIEAIKSSGINKKDIDLIIVATISPDMVFPSTACLLQKKLELANIPAFDIQAACAGFIYALATADAYIKSGMAKTILLVGADVMSRFIDYTDRNTCVLFGDGAGAIILQENAEVGIIANELHADSNGIKMLNIDSRINNGQITGNPFVYMEGQAVFKMAVKNLSAIAISLLNKTQHVNKQIDWLIPHQANLRIIESIAATLDLPMDKVIITLDKHGNTSSASVPLALDTAIRSNKIKRGDLLLLEGVGAGFTWGASLIRY